jgi:hypothetical protein
MRRPLQRRSPSTRRQLPPNNDPGFLNSNESWSDVRLTKVPGETVLQHWKKHATVSRKGRSESGWVSSVELPVEI